MSQGIIKKFGSVLGFEESEEFEMTGPVPVSRPQFKISVFSPKEFDDLRQMADALLDRSAVLIHFDKVDVNLRRRIIDYMNGLTYALGANVEKVSDTIVLYVPENSQIEKDKMRATKSSRWF